MIGMPLPNILDCWASYTGRCEGATAEKACRSRATARRSLLTLLGLGKQNDVCDWSTAAGFWLRWGNGHDRTSFAPHHAFFPSYKAAGFHHASWRRSRVAACGAGAAGRDTVGWIDQ